MDWRTELLVADARTILRILETLPGDDLLRTAEELTLSSFGSLVTYSRKVFIPLTRLCRDVCHYCTFATTPARVTPYLSRDEVISIARLGEAMGCREALFTLGERPEERYAAAAKALDRSGHTSTLDYLRDMAAAVLAETTLLPHLNPGLMDDADYRRLRPVSASMGLMIESTAARLCEPGGPHHGSPDKQPRRRLEALEAAGRSRIPFTTGLLIGIGETRIERVETLLAIRDSHARHGHVQEVIVQNFRAKAGTRMASHPEPDLAEHLWTIAAARLILGAGMTIQAPPNLHAPDSLKLLLRAGVNDWGGVSPVTPDHVNPEAPWPHLEVLQRHTWNAGRALRQRLAIGPAFARDPDRWVDPAIMSRVRTSVDARGLPVTDGWRPGVVTAMPFDCTTGRTATSARIDALLSSAAAGERLSEGEIVALFEADGPDVPRIAAAADALRHRTIGDIASYVVNRNINYTNICLYKCGFCAFSKGSTRSERGPAYRIELGEIARRAREAAARGATEVCLQGGIHPSFNGHTYLEIVSAVKKAVPDIHIHAFSPLEILHGATTLGTPISDYLSRLKDAGLASLPGTAAEILDDEVRGIICPDKLNTAEWLRVMREAHGVGLRSTATIMFGHVDEYRHWARHLLLIRDLQRDTGGFTEFVPLPFVHMEAPMWRKGRARAGPSAREVVLMHAIARLVLYPHIANIQASWVKLGFEGLSAMLRAGVNDMGGTLMDESITRAAGGGHGQHCGPQNMVAIAAAAGRPARERTTFYQHRDEVCRHEFCYERA